ncbi:inhibin alpha chain [Aplochiton taeniatus]
MPSKYLLLLLMLLVLGPLWRPNTSLGHACQDNLLPRELVLDWFKQRLLEGLGVEGPPAASLPSPESLPAGRGRTEAGRLHRRSTRASRWSGAQQQRNGEDMGRSQIILFPSTESPCSLTLEPSGHFTFYFLPSLGDQDRLVSSAHFWFYSGPAFSSANSSSSVAPLFLLTSDQQLLQAAAGPSKTDPDGWSTYQLSPHLHASISQGALVLQVRCPSCQCQPPEPDKMSFLHLHARPRAPERSPRGVAPHIPWSPSALLLLQRPSTQGPGDSDCQRQEISISFQELGWDNWIVHPKAMTFYYCHGNCSALLGIRQCCAPVPGTMRSLRFTTTSDGGYSFKYETLPNIIPDQCTCM